MFSAFFLSKWLAILQKRNQAKWTLITHFIICSLGPVVGAKIVYIFMFYHLWIRFSQFVAMTNVKNWCTLIFCFKCVCLCWVILPSRHPFRALSPSLSLYVYSGLHSKLLISHFFHSWIASCFIFIIICWKWQLCNILMAISRTSRHSCVYNFVFV